MIREFREKSSSPLSALASMGIYLFNWDVLKELLENTDFSDFGKEVIPVALKRKKVYGYFFDGYWEDIGTIQSFFSAHMDLTRALPKFNFYDEEHPIFTHPRFLPGSKKRSFVKPWFPVTGCTCWGTSTKCEAASFP